MSVDLNVLIKDVKHAPVAVEEEDEPISRQLTILKERRRLEEKRKAQYHWTLLRNSVKNTIQAVKHADIRDLVISHGIHHQRKLNHNINIKQTIFIEESKEYLTTDGYKVHTFLEDGRKKETFTPEEQMDHLAYCSQTKQFVGWITDGDELFLMKPDFDIISQSRAPSTIVLAGYNVNTNEFITFGPGYFTTWSFRYGARHLIPRKMSKTDYKENNMFSNMVLESTASRSQKVFLSLATGIVVFNVFEGTLIVHKRNLHDREITCMTFFNPLKYLVTGAYDGTIKVWDHKWHVQMVFVGHSGMVNSVDVYPHGSAIISASMDKTIRVWNLDTCDEVDRAVLTQPVDSLKATLNYDIFYTCTGKEVSLWKIQHLYHIHTSVGQRVVKVRHTTHPNFSTRSVLLSRDSSVRLVCPVSGDVLTTLLLDPTRAIIDAAYAIEEETMFCLCTNGNILKVRTDCNPCLIVKEWPCEDPAKEACNYLLVYEYVIDIHLKTDIWSGLKRGMATKTLQAATGDEDEKPIKPTNRTLLLGGRKDGHVCVYNWMTGAVEFKIDAHGSKGVVNMIANSKVDQLITAGNDNIIKVWRVYPFAEEALAPIMSFYCAHLPIHMTMIKTNLCVAFQDHSTATYSIVIYNLKDRIFVDEKNANKDAYDPGNRFDHRPDDDHIDSITGLSSCPRMKLYASCSLDGTIRIWNETNVLVRMLKLKNTPYSVGFCSNKGDLMVGIGNHLYKIPYHAYLPKAYIFRMVSMKFQDQKIERPFPENPESLKKLSKLDLSRFKNSHSSFKFDHYMDILTMEEEEEIHREQKIKDQAFSILEERENELRKIRDGELSAKRKPKSTKRTKERAFRNYMKMYYDKPRPTIPKDDPFPLDTVQQKLKGEPETEGEDLYMEEREPTGFFPPASSAIKSSLPSIPGTPLRAGYPITPSGFIPNSILVKLLWPPDTKAQYEKERKKKEWKLPTFTAEQLDQISKQKEEGEVDEDDLELKRTVTFADEDEEFDSGRVLELDYEDEEEVLGESKRTSREASLLKEKSQVSEGTPPASSLLSKMQDIMTRTPSPKEEEAEPPVLPPGSTTVTTSSDKSPEKSDLSAKQPSDLKPQEKPPPKRDIKPVKQIVKFAPRPVVAPEKTRTPTPTPSTTVTTTPRTTPAVQPTKTPSPPPKPPTPLPGFVTQFKGKEWFDKYFPNVTENSLPKPWTTDNFINMLARLLKIAEYLHKIAILEAILMIHVQEELSTPTIHAVAKIVISVLNHHKDAPTCMVEDQKNFIVTSLKSMHKMGIQDKEFITECLVQFLDGDKEVRATVMQILTSWGLQDPHKYLPKELDSWDIWNVEEDDRKADLRKMCQQWLDRWMTSYKLHLEDAIERMKKGQNIHGRMSGDQYRRRSPPPSSKSILKRSTGTMIPEDQETVTTLPESELQGKISRSVTVTFDKAPDPSLLESATYMDAINYFCDMMMEKEIEGMRHPGKKQAGQKGNVVQAKNTVLVLPKLPHKPALVRLGETHTSTCRPHRETNLHIDYRLPPMTARGYHPLPGQISGFVNSINLPLKPINLNPFLVL